MESGSTERETRADGAERSDADWKGPSHRYGTGRFWRPESGSAAWVIANQGAETKRLAARAGIEIRYAMCTPPEGGSVSTNKPMAVLSAYRRVAGFWFLLGLLFSTQAWAQTRPETQTSQPQQGSAPQSVSEPQQSSQQQGSQAKDRKSTR